MGENRWRGDMSEKHIEESLLRRAEGLNAMVEGRI
jgi:hypothetical protein